MVINYSSALTDRIIRSMFFICDMNKLIVSIFMTCILIYDNILQPIKLDNLAEHIDH